MDMFEKFRNKAMNLAEVGMTKAKEVGEITKLNLANASEEDNIKKSYIEIGKIYYEANKLTPDLAYAGLCEKIAVAKTRIDENKAKLAEIKADDDVKDAECTCGCCADTEVPPEKPIDPAE